MPPQTAPCPPSATYCSARLERNLLALDEVDPEMGERLRWPVDGDRVRFDAEGRAFYRLHRNLVPFDLDSDRLAPDLAPIADAERVAVLGLGLGEGLDAVLARPGVRRVVAWDRDPYLLRLWLMRRDCADELRGGRLRLSLGSDLLDLDVSRSARLVHPLLAPLYRRELEYLDRRPGEDRIVLCAGGLFVDQLGHALTARGYDLWTVETEALSREELSRTMRRFRPGIVAAINYTEGLVEFCREHGARLLCWEVDPSLSPPCPLAEPPDHAFVFTHRKANVADYRGAGFRHVEYMPLAADPDVRRGAGIEITDREHPVSFVGASMVETAREFQAKFVHAWMRWRGSGPGVADEGQRILSQILAVQRVRPTIFLVPDLLEAHAPGFARAAVEEQGVADPCLLAGELAASEKRLGYLANLGSFGLRVWGDAGWRILEKHGATYQGSAGHGDELTGVYDHSRINVDIGRIYQDDIVTMRVYDVLSCGSFILAEHNEALAEVFEVGVEVESYRTVQELMGKTRHFLEHPDQARDIAARGRDAVHRRHTIAHRAEHMLEVMDRATP